MFAYLKVQCVTTPVEGEYEAGPTNRIVARGARPQPWRVSPSTFHVISWRPRGDCRRTEDPTAATHVTRVG